MKPEDPLPCRLHLPSDPFPSSFTTKTLCAFPFTPIRATRPAYFILFDLIILITGIFGEEHKF
jgi:hypothetical protein